jgi:hypothetical protein
MNGSAIRKPRLAIAHKDAIKKQTTSLPGSPAVRVESLTTLSIFLESKQNPIAGLGCSPGPPVSFCDWYHIENVKWFTGLFVIILDNEVICHY